MFGVRAMATAGSLAVLLAGRALAGCGVGAMFSVGPLLVAELAPEAWRGTLVSLLVEVGVTGGLLLSYVAAWAFSAEAGGRFAMLAAGLALAVPLGALSVLLLLLSA